MTPQQLPQLVWSGALSLAETPELAPEDLAAPGIARFMPLPGIPWEEEPLLAEPQDPAPEGDPIASAGLDLLLHGLFGPAATLKTACELVDELQTPRPQTQPQPANPDPRTWGGGKAHDLNRTQPQAQGPGFTW